MRRWAAINEINESRVNKRYDRWGWSSSPYRLVPAKVSKQGSLTSHAQEDDWLGIENG